MRELHKRLAEQAGGEFYTGFAGSPNTVKFTEDQLIQMINLVVQECVDVVEYKGNKVGRSHPVGFNLLDAAEDIKDHFYGVER